MSLIGSIRNAVENLFVPQDGLHQQAKQTIGDYDVDGDGRINVFAVRDKTQPPPNGAFHITSQGFIAADNLGNKDGYATAKEVHAYIKPYDGDDSLGAPASADGRIAGVEHLALLNDLAATNPASAARQATTGAALVA